MKSKRNPIHKKGDRNALCPHYGGCLDLAVENAWEFWDCCQCHHRLSRDPSLDIFSPGDDDSYYYDIPVEISKKFY
jgi:hypothetical protein